MDKTQKAVEVFNNYANLYEERFMNFDLYNDTFDLFCDSIETKNPEVLELACGPGNITKYLLEKRSDFKILGTDLAPNMIELAQKNNPLADFQLLDCREFLQLNRQFDAILCGFGLPYLSEEDSIQIIKDASSCLNQNGVLYISTMEENDNRKSGYKKASTGDEIYIYYHKSSYLVKTLKEFGFKIISEERKSFPENDGTYTTDLILIAQKIK